MRKIVKLLALVIDVALTPIRLIISTISLACMCVVYEANFKEEFTTMIDTTMLQMKMGIKPTLEIILKKESEA